MDIRVLKYFLAVAREGSVTRAAETLHITQPTLSRQLMELEEELKAELFMRDRRRMTLTESGVLFQQRAKEIVLLLEKTERDLAEQNALVGGVVSIGCTESAVSLELPEIFRSFSSMYPMVKYDIYSADGDDIREKLDRGNIDLGLLIEPIETAKYDCVRLPYRDRWGIVMRKDDPLAAKAAINMQELLGLPLIISRRQIVSEEVTSWFGVPYETLNVVATNNLLTNSIPLAKSGFGYVVSIESAFTVRESSVLKFVPFAPEHTSGHMLAWKKNRIFPPASKLFVEQLKIHFRHDE